MKNAEESRIFTGRSWSGTFVTLNPRDSFSMLWCVMNEGNGYGSVERGRHADPRTVLRKPSDYLEHRDGSRERYVFHKRVHEAGAAAFCGGGR